MLSYGDYLAQIECADFDSSDFASAGLLATADESYEVYVNLARNGLWQGKRLRKTVALNASSLQKRIHQSKRVLI